MMMKAECPRCKKWAEGYTVIDALFGFRRTKKRYTPQSWCKDCRKNKNQMRIDTLKQYEPEVNSLMEKFGQIAQEKKVRKIKIDLLEGLTNSQKTIVKCLARKGYSPMGFVVDVPNDRIFYMGRQII